MPVPRHVASCRTQALLVVLAVAAAVVIAAGCTRNEGKGNRQSTPSEKSSIESVGVDSPESAVVMSAARFGSCLSNIDVPHWKVVAEERDPSRQGRAGNAGIWRMNWNAPSEGEEPKRPRIATAVLVPTVRGMERFRDHFRTDDPVAGKLIEMKRNLLLISYNGDINPALPKAAVAGIERCSKAATSNEPRQVFAGKGFSECKVPDIDPNSIIVDEIRVRGLSCSEVSRTVKKGAEEHEGWCSAFGTDEFTCVSENICCGIFALYVGSAQGEAVIKYGI